MSVCVGVGILARHPGTNKVLLGRRTVEHGKDTWSFPGGHLEFGESFAECAARELLEETNLQFSSAPSLAGTVNNVFDESRKHYVTILLEGMIQDETALRNVEPDKCAGWEWVTEREIKTWIANEERCMFLPIVNYYREREERWVNLVSDGHA